MARNNTEDETPYAVFCREHKLQFLTEAQYNKQMDKPESFWTCPVCGQDADWDDDCQATSPIEEDFEEENFEEEDEDE